MLFLFFFFFAGGSLKIRNRLILIIAPYLVRVLRLLVREGQELVRGLPVSYEVAEFVPVFAGASAPFALC